MNTEYIKQIIFCFQCAYEFTDVDCFIHLYCQHIVDQIVAGISKEQCSIEKKIEKIKVKLKEQIRKYLSIYKREEVNVGLSYLKAGYRIVISAASYEKNDFEYSMRMDEVLHLLLIGNNCKFKEKNSIVDQWRNMEICFRLAYYYSVLCDNIEQYMRQKQDYNTQLEKDLYIILKEGGFYSKEYSSFMDSYLFMNLYEVPEDSEIKTAAIKDRMQKGKNTMEDIRCLQEGAVKDCLGFSFKDLQLFLRYMSQNINNNQYFFMKKKDVIKNIEKEYGIGVVVERIIDYFLMDFQRINSIKKLNRIRLLELKSVLEIGDSILIYPLEFAFNVSCFEKLVLRKHFFEYISVFLEDSQKEVFGKQLDKHVEKMSSFLAYVLLDAFCDNGYTVPKCGDVPIAEIKSIIKVTKDKKQINILKDRNNTIGDIDVLAADEEKKQIYNIEIKYYKPLENVEEMYSKVKRDEREKNIVNPLRRGQRLRDNIEEVLHFLGINSSDAEKYNVRTIFVTPRPDYWLKNENRNIEYYEWVEILDGINKKTL